MRNLFLKGAYIRRGLSKEGNLRFKIDWASFIVGRKVTVFALFYFVYKDSSKYKPPPPGGEGGGGVRLYLEGRFNRGSFALRVWGWGGPFNRNITVLTAADSEAE